MVPEAESADVVVGRAPRNDVARRLADLRQRIDAACERVGRDGNVTIVGVTKTVAVPRIRDLLDAGLTHLGENRLQEAVPKMRELADRAPTWHFIGHLQTNKAERAVELFDRIESLDSLKLAAVLSRSSQAIGRDLRVFVQVKVGDEPTKHGVLLDEVVAFVGAVNELPAICATGLMAIPPKRQTEAETRADFQALRRSFDETRAAHDMVQHLSMGMSADFELAVEEGATEVRVGTILFGPR